MKTTYIYIILFLLISFQGLGQQTHPIQMNYNVSVGTSLLSSNGLGNGMMNYVFPKADFSIGKKWHIKTGVLLTNFSNLTSNDYQFSNLQTSPIKNNVSTAYVMIGGDYQYNENLLIRGSIYKSLNGDNVIGQQTYPQGFNNDAYGMNFGLQYKFSENGILDFQFRYQNGHSPFYHQPYDYRFDGYRRNSFSVFQEDPLFD